MNHHATQNTILSQELSRKQETSPYPTRNKGFDPECSVPMPHTFPTPYLTLYKVLDNASDHVQNQNITEDPDEALHYIINHINVDIVSQLIRKFPEHSFKQVYYSTYIDTTQYPHLQYLISLASKNLRYKNAHAQQLAIEQQVRYYSSDDLSPYLLQCLL